MSRYRPPRPRGSTYITPEGAERMRREVAQLWSVERPRVTRAVSEAAAQGDRSENAEYIYGKKQLRAIDSRLRFLTKRLEDLTVVDRVPDDTTRVYFGAWVELEDEEGAVQRYRIVGPDEADAAHGRLSMDSPLARALMRRREEDEVVVQSPQGEVVLTLLEIRYRPFDDA